MEQSSEQFKDPHLHHPSKKSATPKKQTGSGNPFQKAQLKTKAQNKQNDHQIAQNKLQMKTASNPFPGLQNKMTIGLPSSNTESSATIQKQDQENTGTPPPTQTTLPPLSLPSSSGYTLPSFDMGSALRRYSLMPSQSGSWLSPPILLTDPTSKMDWFGMSQPYFARGVPELRMNDHSAITQRWTQTYQMALGLGLSGDKSIWIANQLTPMAIDSALKHDHPTAFERSNRELNLSPTMVNLPALHFKKQKGNSQEPDEVEADQVADQVVQASAKGVIQRDVVDMPPQTIRSGMPGHLDRLRGDLANPGITMDPDPDMVLQSSIEPNTPLPFQSSGWNGNQIAARLGQYDRIPGTDSDAFRCVQTVALMSHILIGPTAVRDYLSSISLQGMLSRDMTDRRRTALEVIRYVRDRIGSRQATYGDLYWVIEAVHDLFYKDDVGTPEGELHEQITPMMDLSQTMQRLNVWCSTPAELLAQARTLQNGEQFMLNTWNVSFNARFDDLPDEYQGRQQATYTPVDEQGRERPQVTIRRLRIVPDQKPRHTQIDRNRDTLNGHQLLIFKDVSSGAIQLYEPELRQGGQHLFDLSQSTDALQEVLFHDQPNFEMFKYVQILGKITPSQFTSAFQSGS